MDDEAPHKIVMTLLCRAKFDETRRGYKWVYSAREEHQKGTKQLDIAWNDNIRSEALYHHNDPKWNPTQCKGKHNNGERFGKLDLFDSQSIFPALGVGRRSHV